jgi:hypothetical protein
MACIQASPKAPTFGAGAIACREKITIFKDVNE